MRNKSYYRAITISSTATHDIYQTSYQFILTSSTANYSTTRYTYIYISR